MILVTGATGFIGQEVTKYLLKKRKNVRIVSRDKLKATRMFPKVEVIVGDLSDIKIVKNALKNVDTVIHIAGEVSYKKNAKDLYDNNVLATENLVSESKNIKKFIFASSVGVYDANSKKITENSKIKPSSPYGQSKYEAERIIIKSGIPYVSLRIAPVFGAGSRSWARAIKMFEKGIPIPKTKNATHLIHVSDVAEAFYLALGKGKGIYNIAGKDRIKITDLCKEIMTGLGKEPKLSPYWYINLLVSLAGSGRDFKAFTQNRNYDISKAEKELGFKSKANLEKEIKNMVNWYKELKTR